MQLLFIRSTELVCNQLDALSS